MRVSSFQLVTNDSAARVRSRVNAMAISHELSSEIAAALLAAKNRSPRELEDLKEVLLSIHSTLQRLTEDARTARLKSQSAFKRAAAGR
jgi:hypothetical protein